MKYNICMVSDFFYPNVGGVESHLHYLSQRLVHRGHKVIILTHSYGDRKGIRYITNGVKVYYIPNVIITSNASAINFFAMLPIMRFIFIRENIQIVHGHQAFSYMGLEAIFHARTLKLKTCFTDHSLFGFANTSSILSNKFLKFNLSCIDHVICVSHVCKENTVLRASLDPNSVSVIPNAVVAQHFKPDETQCDPNFITIVVISRLVYRKGIDLLIALIPRICGLHPSIRFLIGGDGPKRVELEQMRDRFLLNTRVELVGAIPLSEVRNVLVRGDIFLNTSLTDAFCIGVVEAACCGLTVISTRVGGIPEVLPEDIITFADPEEEDLLNTMDFVISNFDKTKANRVAKHERVSAMYHWDNVAKRTEKVYGTIIKAKPVSLIDRLKKCIFCFILGFMDVDISPVK